MARILVVDDEPDVCAFVCRGLELDGHETKTAADGAAALAALRASGADFDMLVSDIKMPVMDGIQLALAASRDWPAPTIVLMTAYADQRARAHNLDTMIADVLLKPFSLDELQARVRAALAGPTGSPQ